MSGGAAFPLGERAAPGVRSRLISWFVKLFWLPFIALAAIIIICSIDFYLARNHLWPLSPTAFALGSFLSVFYVSFIKGMMRDKCSLLFGMYGAARHVLLGYAAMAALSLVYALHPAMLSRYGVGETTFLYAYSLLLLLAAYSTVVFQIAQKHMRVVFALAAVIYFCSIIADLVYGGIFTKVEGRAAGFAGNPNTGAFTLIMLMTACANWKEYKIVDGMLWGMTAVGTLATFSRAGIVLFAASFGLYALFVILPGKSRFSLKRVLKLLLTAALVYTLLTVLVAPLLQNNAFLSTYTAQKRLDMITGLIGGSGGRELKEDSRTELVAVYLNEIAASPIIGHGAGYTEQQTLGPHNMYLLFWTNFGILGLLALLYFISSVWMYFWQEKDIRGIAFTLVFAIQGFFAHDLMTYRPFLVMLAFLCAWTYADRSKGRT